MDAGRQTQVLRHRYGRRDRTTMTQAEGLHMGNDNGSWRIAAAATNTRVAYWCLVTYNHWRFDPNDNTGSARRSSTWHGESCSTDH